MNSGKVVSNQIYIYVAVKWLMSIKGIGRISTMKILEDINDFQRVSTGSYEDLKEIEASFGKPLRAILPFRDIDKFKQQYVENQFIDEDGKKNGIITYWDKGYPEALKQIHDPPLILYYKGNVNLLSDDISKVAIVGTRVPSEYGRKYGSIISQKLSNCGYAIVSGMAMGIDAIAHKAAIDGDNLSIGVLGCGIDQIYPKQNEKLYQRILDKGLIISEYEKGVQPHPIHFPERNRIIAGLSESCIVIEAAKKSGSLITAEMTLDLGRDVYAMPGPIYSSKSIGCHELIKNGAIPIVSVEDLEISFSKEDRWNNSQNEPKTNPQNHLNHPIVKYLEVKGDATLEDIISALKLPLSEAFETLDELVSENAIQMKGFIYHLEYRA